jgi:hypothetical protein
LWGQKLGLVLGQSNWCSRVLELAAVLVEVGLCHGAIAGVGVGIGFRAIVWYRWSCCWSGAVGFGTSCRRGEGRMLLLLLE